MSWFISVVFLLSSWAQVPPGLINRMQKKMMWLVLFGLVVSLLLIFIESPLSVAGYFLFYLLAIVSGVIYFFDHIRAQTVHTFLFSPPNGSMPQWNASFFLIHSRKKNRKNEPSLIDNMRYLSSFSLLLCFTELMALRISMKSDFGSISDFLAPWIRSTGTIFVPCKEVIFPKLPSITYCMAW